MLAAFSHDVLSRFRRGCAKIHRLHRGFLGRDSICTVRDSPCHDEHVIYEIARDATAENNPGRPGPRLEWKMDAYKIVNGEKQFTGISRNSTAWRRKNSVPNNFREAHGEKLAWGTDFKF